METEKLNIQNEKDLEINIQDPVGEGSVDGPSDYLKDLFKYKKSNEGWADKVGFMGGPTSKRRGRTLVAFSWAAAMIDSILVFSVSTLIVVTLSLAVRQLDHNIFLFLNSIPRLHLIGAVFLFTVWLYQVLFRVFTGSTLGEWCFDLRMGTPFDRLLLSYSLKVVYRSTLSILSGLVLFPFFSLLLGEDILGRLCGLKIHSIK